MLKIGLTGGIASGKTTITKLLVEKGAYHIDFDFLAHQVEEKGTDVWRQIVSHFGPQVLGDDGGIDRKKLSKIVFNDPEKLKLLNRLVHPAVIEEWRKRLQEIEAQDAYAIILNDVPLLFEAGLQDLFDYTILVYSPPEMQVKRLMERNGYTEKEARLRLAAQMPIDEKIPLADIVFDNTCSLADVKNRVEKLWEELTRLQREKYKKGAFRYDWKKRKN